MKGGSFIMKIILAYSGGLDTSVILKWLQGKYKAEVITYTADIGQGISKESLTNKALNTGAKKVYIEDLREEFAHRFILPALKAGALYEGKYPLATALSRPLIAEKLVEVARKEKATALAHGCTGKGNDQVRIEVSVSALAPHMKVIAPVREWEFASREEEMEYAKKYNIPVSSTKSSPYSVDENLWGISCECGVLEDPAQEPPEEVYQITKSIEKSPSKAQYVKIYLEQAVPKKLDGKSYKLPLLIKKLNEIGGRHGVGRIDMVEDRLVGIKSREIYEAPAATILHKALDALENLTLDRETYQFKQTISPKYAQLVYYGLWHSQLKESLDVFMDKVQECTTGEVTVKLHKGNCTIVSRKSPNSLYHEKLATYTKKDIFDHKAAEGFIQLWGLPLKVKAMKKGKTK